jgi:hypothetical protein
MKLKGLQAQGIRYEKTIGKMLRREFPEWDIHSSQWITFRDKAGLGFAQPDHYVVFSERILLIECKRTQTDRIAVPQMQELYRPLLHHIYKKPIQCVQCCKFAGRGMEVTIIDIEKALFLSPAKPLLWHCLL